MKKGILKLTACFLAIILIMALFPLSDYGMKPKYYDDVIGKTAVCNLKRGTPLNEKHVR